MTRHDEGQGGSAPAAQESVNLEPNLQDPDRFYEELLAAHDGLSTEQSFELNARLLLLLANQVGDSGVLSRCIALARAAATPPACESASSAPARAGD